VEGEVVAAGAKIFGVDCEFSFAPATCFDFGFPVKFFVASVAEAFGVMFFFGFAIKTGFDHHCRKNTFAY
jgi:hypothetical protein